MKTRKGKIRREKAALPRSDGVYLMAVTDRVRHYFILRFATTVNYFSTRGTRTYPRVLVVISRYTI
eukprot:12116994-Ditylum_brightwellii.AAC.1